MARRRRRSRRPHRLLLAAALAVAIGALAQVPAAAAGPPRPAAPGTTALPAGRAACPSTASKPSSPTAACVMAARASGPARAPLAPTSGVSVSLTAFSILSPGEASVITATASLDVGPTPYYIEIFDQTAGTLVAVCGFGSTCQTSITYPFSTIRDYVAYVSEFGESLPAPNVQATSGTALVTWLAVDLVASPTALAGGQLTMLTATAGLDVGPTPYFLEIFNLSLDGGTLVATCGAGLTCVATYAPPGPGSYAFAAYISRFSPGFPLNDSRAFSPETVIVSWS
jgi:hypothetical protein